jgi:hypothetical protein
MHTNNIGQSCDGRHCIECGKCEACSHKAKTPTAIFTRNHVPHVYEKPVTKKRRKGATV